MAGFRIVTTRVVAVFAAALLLLNESCWPKDGTLAFALKMTGIVLIVAGAFGRLWCTLFISGYKTERLITSGPYSIARNPLYLFSFIGILGIAMSTQMLTVVALVILLFAFYYPTVIVLEERKLLKLHGAVFEEYCKKVPSFIPKFSGYQEPETYAFTTRLYRKAMFDAMWFVLVYPLIGVIEHLHRAGWLPAYYQIW